MYWVAVIVIVGGLLTIYVRKISNEEEPTKHTFRSSTSNVEQYSRKPAPSPGPNSTPTIAGELLAAAGCVAGRVVVQNKSGDPWTDVKIEVNRNYVHVADGIPPRETYRFLPAIFTTGGGVRLDLSSVACKTIDIHATTTSGRAHWNVSYGHK